MNYLPTSGLRDLPLSQYLLRGRRSNAASQYEELRRLQQNQAALTPLTCGRFRLFISRKQEAMLQSVQKDRKSIVASLNQGVEVVLVEPAERGAGGKITGFIDKGQLRVVLKHELEPPAPGDWRLLSVKADLPYGPCLATLVAEWSLYKRQDTEPITGKAEQFLTDFNKTKNDYQAWSETWQPPEIDAGTLVLHVSKKLRENESLAGKLLDDLFSGKADVYVVKQHTRQKNRVQDMLLFLPTCNICLAIRKAPFVAASVGHWLLWSLDREPGELNRVCRLSARWIPAHKANEVDEFHHDWLRQICEAEQALLEWKQNGWRPRELHGGPFRLRISSGGRKGLEQLRIEPEKLCDAMSRGLHLYNVLGQDRDRLVVVPYDLHCQLCLTPYKPSIGNSDWNLINIRKAESAEPTFARIQAEWELGTPQKSSLEGDAPSLIGELEVLQDRRKEYVTQIRNIVDQLDSSPPELSDRIACWRKVCELERKLLRDVGVGCIKRDAEHYTLIPKEQETVMEWIENLESFSPEGIDWERYPLELRVGDNRVILKICSIETGRKGLAVKVSCNHPDSGTVLEQICDGEECEGEKWQEVQLYLPDTQLRLIENALNLLNPEQTSGSKNSGVVGEDLAPDDLTLHTIRRILAKADDLEPANEELPPLMFPPLSPLSLKQEEAVRTAIFGSDLTLIQGPPGAGKTTVILEILHQLFRMHGRKPGFKVLLVAPTHVAVDNVLERLVGPKGGTNVMMELGVAPYRIGSTQRIAEHLRGFTPDCFNTEYREALERRVARSIDQARWERDRDLKVREILEDGAVSDAVSWLFALQSGEFLDLGPWEWHPSLAQQLPNDLDSQEGRVRAWRNLRTRGSHPEKRVELLERWLEFLSENPRFFSELLLANANLVCATTVGCATHRELRPVIYDYVIVDEAGKEEARRLLVSLIRGERWVLIGDHQQLPPYADDSLQACLVREGLDPRIVTCSLFEELEGPCKRTGRYVFLDHQGRMHPDISAFVSHRFYHGCLHDFPNVVSHTMPSPRFLPKSPNLLVLDTRHLPDRQETREGTGYVNLLEQELAGFVLHAFARLPMFRDVAARSNMPTIGVIAPYRRQVEGITKKVQEYKELKLLLTEGVLQVGTVDSFQGQEKDLVIFSCTRSNDRGRLGFVDNRQRLNVALSRARCRLIVLVDGNVVELAQACADVSDFETEIRDHLHALMAFARERGGVLEVPKDWRTCWHV